MKKRTLRSNQETDEGKRCAALANSLTKKAPYKGLGAESGQKREPASDIDTAVVDSLKALDPEWPIREADFAGRFVSARPNSPAREESVDPRQIHRQFTVPRFDHRSLLPEFL